MFFSLVLRRIKDNGFDKNKFGSQDGLECYYRYKKGHSKTNYLNLKEKGERKVKSLDVTSTVEKNLDANMIVCNHWGWSFLGCLNFWFSLFLSYVSQ